MKKTISVIMTLIILVSSVLCINAMAAGSKTEAFINKMNETKSIGLTIPDSEFDFGKIKLTNCNLAAKVITDKNGKNDLKIAGNCSIFGIKAKIVLDGNNVYAMIPLLKINITDLLDISIGTSDYADIVMSVFDILNKDIFECLKLSSAEDKNVDGYGTVNVEHFNADVKAIAKKAVEKGIITLPEGVSADQLTEEKLLEYADLAGGNADRVATMLTSYADFYYRNGTLVGFKVYLCDLDGASQTVSSADVFPFAVSEIKTDIKDSEFKTTGLYFDITNIVKLFLSFLISM